MIKTHPHNPHIALPGCLEDLKATRNSVGALCLTDEFRTYRGAIFKSPELETLAASFDYEAHGYGVMLSGPAMPERSAIAEYMAGKVYPIRQAISVKGENGMRLKVSKLEDDMKTHEPVWRSLFEKFATVVAPTMGRAFEIRLKPLDFKEEWFHNDKDIIGILPLGNGRRSTVCAGLERNVYPDDGSLVITTPPLSHSSPVSGLPRVGLAVTVYSRHMR